MAMDEEQGANKTILLAPHMEREMGEDCRATKLVLSRYFTRNLLYLDGAIALARSINANDDDSIMFFYNLLTGNAANKAVMDAISQRRLRLPLPRIERPALENWNEIEKEAFKFLKAA
jgi:hypothetical protein